MVRQNRMVTANWDLYDTRHVVYQPTSMSPEELKSGYDWSYEAFYRWNSVFKAAAAHELHKHQLKHFFYSAGWKKFEPAWDFVIHLKQLSQMRPILEAVLSPVRSSSAAVADTNRPQHARQVWEPSWPLTGIGSTISSSNHV